MAAAEAGMVLPMRRKLTGTAKTVADAKNSTSDDATYRQLCRAYGIAFSAQIAACIEDGKLHLTRGPSTFSLSLSLVDRKYLTTIHRQLLKPQPKEPHPPC